MATICIGVGAPIQHLNQRVAHTSDSCTCRVSVTLFFSFMHDSPTLFLSRARTRHSHMGGLRGNRRREIALILFNR